MEGSNRTVAEAPARDGESSLLPEVVSYLRDSGKQLREEWVRRITDAELLQAMSPEEIDTEVSAVYDNYVDTLETGSVETLQAYARDLSERIIPRGVESSRIASCCSRITRSRSWTKLTPTVTAIRFAAGS